MDLNLRGVFFAARSCTVISICGASLDNGIAGAFLCSVLLLATHWLRSCLYSAMRATSCTLWRDSNLLNAALATTLTLRDPTS